MEFIYDETKLKEVFEISKINGNEEDVRKVVEFSIENQKVFIKHFMEMLDELNIKFYPEFEKINKINFEQNLVSLIMNISKKYNISKERINTSFEMLEKNKNGK